jgi:hypothetical protein
VKLKTLQELSGYFKDMLKSGVVPYYKPFINIQNICINVTNEMISDLTQYEFARHGIHLPIPYLSTVFLQNICSVGI